MPSTRLTRLKRLRLKLDIDRPAAHPGEHSMSHTSRAVQPTASAPDSQARPSRLSLRRAAMARGGARR
jgi:hypothetical protein